MRALITRPMPDAAPLAERLLRHGIACMIEPMLEIHPLPGIELDLAGVQALLVTSSSGARALAAAVGERSVPLFAVGDATAAVARDAGFTQVTSAAGAVDDLARLAAGRLDPAAGALVHAGGSSVAGGLAGQMGAAGFDVRRAVLYEARPCGELSPACRGALADGGVDCVVFFSPRSAGTFVSLVAMAGLADRASALQAFCLSDAVAAAAGEISWRGVEVSPRPDLDAMIDLLVRRSAP